MILIDPRDGATKDEDKKASRLLVSYLRGMGLEAELSVLDSADICFDGNGPGGRISIGVERKTLHDMLRCIDTGNYNEQARRMRNHYNKVMLMVEGRWKCHEQGYLMEGWPNKYNDQISWGFCKPYGHHVYFSKLYNYLLSVANTGVTVTYPTDLYQLAQHINNTYRYYHKKWTDHTSTVTNTDVMLPTLDPKGPSLTRLWANCLDGVGVKYSIEAERVFRRPIKLATADEIQWLAIEGIGVPTARRIVREINEGRK